MTICECLLYLCVFLFTHIPRYIALCMRSSRFTLRKARIYYPSKSSPREFEKSRRNDLLDVQDFRSKNSSDYAVAKKLLNERLHACRMETRFSSQNLSWGNFKELCYGRCPESSGEKQASENLDAKEGISEARKRLESFADRDYFSKRRSSYLSSIVSRIKNIRNPSADLYQRSRRELYMEKSDARKIRIYRKKLDETEITSEQRLDAYFLGDESMFPLWAKRLGQAFRDRVLYGGIGITEHDEAMRTKLLSLPMSMRKARWYRLKQLRRRIDGKECLITQEEKLAISRCSRKHKWHLIQRLEHRAREEVVDTRNKRSHEKRKVLEEQTEPMRAAASFVQAGLPTLGTAELDPDFAEKRLRLIQEDRVMGSFIHKSHLNTMNIDPKVYSSLQGIGMAQALHTKKSPVKRLSRKNFKNRWAGIVSGTRDECGRRIVEEKRIFPKHTMHKSFIDFAQEREELGMPLPHSRAQKGLGNELWSARYQYKNSTLSVGLPSPTRGWY